MAEQSEEIRTLRDRMYEAAMRVERIVHTESMLVESPDRDLIEWLTEHDDLLEAIKAEVDWDESWGSLADLDPEEFMEATWGLKGWVVEVAQPVMKRNGVGFSYSWGHYRTRRFLAPSYPEALEAGLAWAESNYEQVVAEATQSGSSEEGDHG